VLLSLQILGRVLDCLQQLLNSHRKTEMNDTNHDQQQRIESVLVGERHTDDAPLRDFGPVSLQSEPMSKKKKMVIATLGVVALVGATFSMDTFDFMSHPKPEVSLSPQAPPHAAPVATASEPVQMTDQGIDPVALAANLAQPGAASRPVQMTAQGIEAVASAANPVQSGAASRPVQMTAQAIEAVAAAANLAQPGASQSAIGTSTKPTELTAAQIAMTPPALSPANKEVLSKVGEVLESMKELKEEVKTLRAQVRRADALSSKLKAEPVARSEMIAVTVVEVSPTVLTLVSEGKKVTLRIGEKMPGGAVFLGFDQGARKLKTDQGDFTIPS
jgi:hypothetical protein